MIVQCLRFLMPLGEPLGLIWLLNVCAAGFMLLRRKWSCAVVLAALAVLSSLAGGTPIAQHLLADLEQPYARAELDDVPKADAIVMLGGTHSPSRHDVFGFGLNEQADRIVTTMELLRQGKAKALVLGGGTATINGKQQHLAELLKPWLSAAGLDNVPVYFLENCNNTRDEALGAQKLVEEHSWKSVLLVTSAFHMRRSEAVFKKVGVQVVPVGCDFQAYGVPDIQRTLGPVPKVERFYALGLYWREQLGWFVYKWQGWID